MSKAPWRPRDQPPDNQPHDPRLQLRQLREERSALHQALARLDGEEAQILYSWVVAEQGHGRVRKKKGGGAEHTTPEYDPAA